MLKPSELNIATVALLTELFPKYLDPDMFAIVNGSVKETQKLLELRWDHSTSLTRQLLADHFLMRLHSCMAVMFTGASRPFFWLLIKHQIESHTFPGTQEVSRSERL